MKIQLLFDKIISEGFNFPKNFPDSLLCQSRTLWKYHISIEIWGKTETDFIDWGQQWSIQIQIEFLPEKSNCGWF